MSRWASSFRVSLALLANVLLGLCTAEDSDWRHVLDHGSVLGFPSYDEANRLLDGWCSQYPSVLSRRKIGSSYENRDIYAYILTASYDQSKPAPDASDQKVPQVLVTSLMHSREPASLTVVLNFIGHSLELYASGAPETVYLMQTREIWLVPFVNPDGYKANEKPSQKRVRKNRRPTGCVREEDNGVDINRNFGFHWKEEFQRCNEEYQGEHAFSEGETQAIQKITEENKFAMALNFHTFGRMLTFPFNWATKPEMPPEDLAVFREVGKFFGYPKVGPAIETVGYTAPGESDDWLYGVRHIYSMSPEVGPEEGNFWPKSSEIKDIDDRNFDRIVYVVHKSGLQLEAAWRSKPASSPTPRVQELAGGPPRMELELELRNTGVIPSAGQALGVAISGATVNMTVVPYGTALVQLDGAEFESVRSVALAGGSQVALSFSVPPLLRRSSRNLTIFVGRSFEVTSPRELDICLSEPTKTSGSGSLRALCRCGKISTLLVEAANGLESSAEVKDFYFVFANEGSDARRGLCEASQLAATRSGANSIQSPAVAAPAASQPVSERPGISWTPSVGTANSKPVAPQRAAEDVGPKPDVVTKPIDVSSYTSRHEAAEDEVSASCWFFAVGGVTLFVLFVVMAKAPATVRACILSKFMASPQQRESTTLTPQNLWTRSDSSASAQSKDSVERISLCRGKASEDPPVHLEV